MHAYIKRYILHKSSERMMGHSNYSLNKTIGINETTSKSD